MWETLTCKMSHLYRGATHLFFLDEQHNKIETESMRHIWKTARSLSILENEFYLFFNVGVIEAVRCYFVASCFAFLGGYSLWKRIWKREIVTSSSAYSILKKSGTHVTDFIHFEGRRLQEPYSVLACWYSGKRQKTLSQILFVNLPRKDIDSCWR